MNNRRRRKRIQRAFDKNQNELCGILLRKYPVFVLSDYTNELTDTPAFVFHDVTSELLEPMLNFLSSNEYATLTADEYFEPRTGSKGGRECEILLTIDDGDKSLYSTVYPALKRYDPGLLPISFLGGLQTGTQPMSQQAGKGLYVTGKRFVRCMRVGS